MLIEDVRICPYLPSNIPSRNDDHGLRRALGFTWKVFRDRSEHHISKHIQGLLLLTPLLGEDGMRWWGGGCRTLSIWRDCAAIQVTGFPKCPGLKNVGRGGETESTEKGGRYEYW